MRNQSKNTEFAEQFVVSIRYWDGEEVHIALDDVDLINSTAAETSLDIDSFETNCDDFVTVLEALAPFAERFGWGDELLIGGVGVEVADHVNGTSWFVPSSDAAGVVWIDSGRAAWETIGPCIFNQSEDLLRMGNLYWVNTHGDTDQQRIVVGRFDDEVEAIKALAEASIYFTFHPEKGLICGLDEVGEVEL